jgi:hypothetical protein
MKKTILFSALSLILFTNASVSSAATECETRFSGSCMWGDSCATGTNLGSYGCSSGQVCCGSQQAWSNQNFPGQSAATPSGGGNQSSGFISPIGPTTIEGVLGNIMTYLQGIAGTIAVIFIIIGGIMYMVSGGSKETAERAKKTLIYAIAGLAIVLAAPLFYTEIKAVISGNSPGSALQALLLNILKLLLAIVGFLAIISMVVGAIWMLTAVGDEDRYELGKKTAGYSILGLVIALSALIIANQVTSLMGGSSSFINSAANSPATGAIPSLPINGGVPNTPVNGGIPSAPITPNNDPSLPGTIRI